MCRNQPERRAVDEPDYARARLPRAHRVKRRRHMGVSGDEELPSTVNAPDSRRARILFYDDGAYRFRIIPPRFR